MVCERAREKENERETRTTISPSGASFYSSGAHFRRTPHMCNMSQQRKNSITIIIQHLLRHAACGVTWQANSIRSTGRRMKEKASRKKEKTDKGKRIEIQKKIVSTMNTPRYATIRVPSFYVSFCVSVYS